MKVSIEKILISPYFIIGAILLNVLIHLPFMNTPPHSIHVWRQCNTLAVARNFYEEEMNILKTRVDSRYETSGITGSHFPSYEYGLAALYKITGEQMWVHRFYSMVIFILGGIALLKLLELIFSNKIIASIGFYSYLFAPELFYHQINALPDILSLSSSIAGFLFFIKWFEGNIKEQPENKYLDWFLATVFTTLAGLTKLQYLAIGFPIAIYFFLNIKKISSIKIWVLSGIYGTVSVLVSLYWYKRAVDIIKGSGLTDFGIEFRPETDPEKALQILSKNLFSWLPETNLNFASFALFLFGCYYFFKKRPVSHKWFYPFVVYTLALIAYHLIELRQMDHHGYYMIPYYIVLLAIVGYGGYFLFSKKQYLLLALLLILQPAFATLRIVPARWMKENKGIPNVLYHESSRKEIQAAVPKDAKVLAGPDKSGCILFYLVDKKGYGFPDTTALLYKGGDGKNMVDRFIDHDGKYLYYLEEETPMPEGLKSYISRIILHKGPIIIAELKK